jgi:flavin-dependent dehydrogenase
MLHQTDVEVLRGRVLGHQGHVVYTTQGAFDAGMLIDATGCRAALATNGQRQTTSPQGMSFGIETVIPVRGHGLHFWYEPGRLLPKGVTWLFPVGAHSRAGIASYLGRTRLKQGLVDWLRSDFGHTLNATHGGYFPYRTRPARSGRVLSVGDAAGQCLPLTGEGIRPALYFGTAAGLIARSFSDGALSEVEALEQYQRFVRRHAVAYNYILASQKVVTNIPVGWVESVGTRFEKWGLFPQVLNAYRRAIDPRLIALRPEDSLPNLNLIRRGIAV